MFTVPCQDFYFIFFRNNTGSLHDTTNAVTENPEVGVHVPGWRVTLHWYVGQYAQV